MKKTISWLLICAMLLSVAATSCKKDELEDGKPDTENPGEGEGEGEGNQPGEGEGNQPGEGTPSAFVVKYTGGENMKNQYVNVGLWNPELKNESNWTALETGIGQFGYESPANEAHYDKAILSSLKAGDKIWVCIEKVAKYFHTLTAEEIAAGEVSLPDKDGGNTMLPAPTLGGKPYVNDWVVTLYMGVEAWSGRPLYWATGNLVAVKTGGAGAPTEPAFYLATMEETHEAALGGNNNPYNSTNGSKETVSTTDGYIGCAEGYRWDCFMPLDGTGIRTDWMEGSTEYVSATIDFVRQNVQGETKNWAFGGFDGYDLVSTQLKGAWSIPDRYDSLVETSKSTDTPIDRSAAANGGKLGELIYKTDRTSALYTDGNKQYWKVVYQTKGFENTILLPASAMRRIRDGKITSDNGHRVVVMASGVAPGKPNFMAFDTYAPDGIDAGFGYNGHHQKYVCIRPVTE